MIVPPFAIHDIDAIARGLLKRTLPKPAWTHAAHFAAALWLLADRGDEAFATMPAMIRAYNEATGVANTDTTGYHATITIASLRAAKHMLATSSTHDLATACATLLESPLGASNWPLTYWSRPLLFSSSARRHWIDPDILALPFP